MTEGIQIIIGALLPPVIDLINRRISSSKVRYVISVVVCLLLGVALNYQGLSLSNPETFLTSFGLIFASAQTTYKMYWKENRRI